MAALPTGTVTLMFTDVEGSTNLLRALGDRYRDVLAEHRETLRSAFGEHGGVEVDSIGDGLYWTFPTAREAVLAAVAAQRDLARKPWPDGAEVRVRIGIHTGEPKSGEIGYVGLDVHRAARIGAAGHGGQVLVSRTTHDLIAGDPPDGISLRDLGEHRLKDMPGPEHLFQVVAAELTESFPALRVAPIATTELPRQLTTFVGRVAELESAREMLLAGRMLTLTGPGGVGKTRLAVELGGRLVDEHDGGVSFVELANLTDPGFVLNAIASALHLAEEPGRPLDETIVEHLHSRSLLLVLDNCEHVLAAAAQTAHLLLQATPNVRILATGREALAVPGEQVFPVPSLSLPALDTDDAGQVAESEAVRLFEDRARAGSPAFRVTEQNASTIAAICRQLDGIPLAIELAAARVRALPVDEIRARLSDRFRLLTGSGRVTVPRHQTLRATMDWSFDLLADEERALLRRLSVFVSGTTIEAAEAVCAGDLLDGPDVLELIGRLIDKSLVMVDVEGLAARYQLLETVRQYARERLIEAGEAAATMRRHRDWYVRVAETATQQLYRGQESPSDLARLDREHDDLRAALRWSLDEPGEEAAGLMLGSVLWRFWEIRGHISEGRAWLERIVTSSEGSESRQLADALAGLGVLTSMQGDYAAAAVFLEEALDLQRKRGDRQSIAHSLNNLANAVVLQGDYERALQLYRQSHDVAAEMGDFGARSFGLMNLADVEARLGDHESARGHFEASLAAFRQSGDRWGEAFALDSFGTIALRSGDAVEARRLHEEALAISRDLQDYRSVARTLARLADVAMHLGNAPKAVEFLRLGLTLRRSLGDFSGIASVAEQLAWAVRPVDAHAAARLLGTADALRDQIRAPLPPDLRGDHERIEQELRTELGAEVFERERGSGRSMTPEDALPTSPP
jgi:predicted ATPase/class 3 adenylate cyclase